MSDSVGRKKSQRWVSASKGNYDGQEWDSSEDEIEDYEGHDSGVERHGTVTKLPPLPKLGYGKSSEETVQARDETAEKAHVPNVNTVDRLALQENSGNFSEESNRHSQMSGSVCSGFGYSESDEECRVSKTGYFASMIDGPGNSNSGTDISENEGDQSLTTDSSEADQKRLSDLKKNQTNPMEAHTIAETHNHSGAEQSQDSLQGPLKIDKIRGSSLESAKKELIEPLPETSSKAEKALDSQNKYPEPEETEDSPRRSSEIGKEQVERRLPYRFEEESKYIPQISSRSSSLPPAESEVNEDNSNLTGQHHSFASRSDPHRSKRSSTEGPKYTEGEVQQKQEQEQEQEQEQLQEQEQEQLQEQEQEQGQGQEQEQEQEQEQKEEEAITRSQIIPKEFVSNSTGTRQSSSSVDANPEPIRRQKPDFISSSDEYEDNASFFNQYGNNSIQSSPADNADRSPSKGEDWSPVKLRQTSKTRLKHSEENLNQTGDDDNQSFKFKNRMRDSILDSSDDDIDDDRSVLRVPKTGYYAQILKETSQSGTHDKNDDTDTDTDDISSGMGSITKSFGKFDQNSYRDTDHESNGVVETSDSETATINGSANSDQSVKAGEGSRNLNSRQSINLGKWQPNTDATRADFLGEASPQVPEGYVIDRDGQMVNLNPASIRDTRTFSTYSEAESAWNAFPTSSNITGNEDLDTIYDTKTIYDNQTIYNVPGIATNTDSLPPLPHDITGMNSSQANTITDSDSILKHLNGEKRQHSSNLRENFSIHAPGSKEIAELNSKAVPQMSLDALLQAKNKLHYAKIKELENFSSELKDYDSGLPTWINYALTNSTSDKDYIFQDYKISKHVKDAYAQADELSKKVSMTITVSNVNQNVSHLKRKVFSQSMKEKSKGLFSSIGGKKKA
ncbi:LANO_0E15874g1_1 [Lachancea nothofagi CBS 11611]|uniref:LANO_0E15874g1_1 n=1 Tax=Lachancea nothofagi CBS 11611 TaxID=1266666 RepID=A0A1G4K1F9_9SACH|nr:LANO_0E15874g1_1 [Lachancea nothofagi CBS 11611]